MQWSSSVTVPMWTSVMLTSRVRLTVTAQVTLSQFPVGAAVVVGHSDKQVIRSCQTQQLSQAALLSLLGTTYTRINSCLFCYTKTEQTD